MLAPIVLFVYKRLDHTKRTLEALAANQWARDSDLIIYADEAKSEKDRGQVEAVRQYVAEVKGFRSVNVVKRLINYGLSKSILEGVSEVLREYRKVIVLEDDLVTSPYFLKYMNEALDKYEDQEDVISIHGYIYPLKEQMPETFFLLGADCWGWATWQRGWNYLERDGLKLKRRIEQEGTVRRFNFGNSYPYMRMLSEQIAGKNNSWAILWYASAFVHKKITLYPGRSLVNNIGNDDSGTHSITTNEYDVALSSVPIDLTVSPPLKDDREVVRLISNFFRQNHSAARTLRYFISKFLYQLK